MMELQLPGAVLTTGVLMLICSAADPDDVRLVGGSSCCAGTVEVFHTGDWRRVTADDWSMKDAAVVCRQLGCGSAVAATGRELNTTFGWGVQTGCSGTESTLRECLDEYDGVIWLSAEAICSDSVRLVDGAGRCSGRVEVKPHQSWTTVCDADFDWQDAEVVCRELGCGSPLNVKGALFGEREHPFGNKEFQCKGTEDHLLDCSTSDGEQHTCTRAAELTCSEPVYVRLVDRSSRCAGTVEMFHGGAWRRVNAFEWSMTKAALVCRQLDCGSAVAVPDKTSTQYNSGWSVDISCNGSESTLTQCKGSLIPHTTYPAGVICSDLVRLVDGTKFCSGRVEVKSPQSWTTVCEADFDWKDAEVVCRELDCGPPLTLQGALFGEGTLPFGTKELHCEGTEDRLLNCSTSEREEQPCTGGKAVGLTCSEVRLVDGSSRCAGTVETFHRGGWRKVRAHIWTLMEAYVVCRLLGCGLAVAAVDRTSGSSLPAVITRMLLVPFLMLITCLSVFLILKKWGHVFIKNSSGQQGATEAAVRHEKIELVSHQSRAEEDQEEEKQDRN